MKFKKLTALTDEAAQGLNKSLGDTLDREILTQDIAEGISELYEIDGGKAYAITRIEPKELVICCFQGSGLREAAPRFVAAAKAAGCTSIRFHTENTALARLLSEYKPKHIEHVYRVYFDD